MRQRWSSKELHSLEAKAGTESYKMIGRPLGRSANSVKAAAHKLGITNNDAGYLSINEFCREYKTYAYRVRRLIREEKVSAKRKPGTVIWLIDPHSITKEIEDYLASPRKTWIHEDYGDPDYNKRYGFYQMKIDGKAARIPLSWKARYSRSEIIEIIRKNRNQQTLDALKIVFGKNKLEEIKELADYYKTMPDMMLAQIIQAGIEQFRVSNNKIRLFKAEKRKAVING